MIDTCQANTMYSKFYSPNILATGSSDLGESSYSVRRSPSLLLNILPDGLFKHANDYDIGVAVIDAYTHYVLEFMENINKTSQASMEELVGRLLLLSASTKRPKLSS
jgi:phosphatidylinositol glycan class K